MTQKIIAALVGFALLLGTVQAFAASKFADAECFQGTSTGQKKAAPAVKGTLFFNTEKKSVEFLDKKGSPTFSIAYDSIKTMLYEQSSTPRYTAAVLISPMFLLSHSKKHYLTIQYNSGADGNGQYMIVHLDKKNARDAVAAAEAETGKTVERSEEK